MRHLLLTALGLPLLAATIGCNNTKTSTTSTDSLATTSQTNVPDTLAMRYGLPTPIMAVKLGLSDAQVQQIDSIRMTFHRSMEPQGGPNGGPNGGPGAPNGGANGSAAVQPGTGAPPADPNADRAKFEERRKNMEEAVRNVLTAEQQAKLQAMPMPPQLTPDEQKQIQDKQIDKLKADLNLTDAQVNQTRALESQMANDTTHGRHGGPDGGPGMHFGPGMGFGAGAGMIGPMRDKFRDILTPAQKAKFDSMSYSHGPRGGMGGGPRGGEGMGGHRGQGQH